MIWDFAKRTLKKLLPIKGRLFLARFKSQIMGLEHSYRGLTTEEVFEKIYKEGVWGRDAQLNPTSGSGSHNEIVVRPYIECVRTILNEMSHPVIVDLGCGDFNVGKNFVGQAASYIACDISKTILERNIQTYPSPNVTFKQLNVSKDELPKADIAFIRQVLQHLSNDDIACFVKNINKNSPYKYLVVTEHVPAKASFKPNIEKPTGPGIRVQMGSGVDITKDPFNLQCKEKKVVLEVPEEVYGVDAIIRTTLFTLF